MCVCVCVRVCVRARVCVCVRACVRVYNTTLAGELDAQDQTIWWPAVSKFIELHFPLSFHEPRPGAAEFAPPFTMLAFGGSSAHAGEQGADAAEGGGAGGSEGTYARGAADVEEPAASSGICTYIHTHTHTYTHTHTLIMCVFVCMCMCVCVLCK